MLACLPTPATNIYILVWDERVENYGKDNTTL